MKKESNEVRYKLAELLLKKMQENGLISAEEREKIAVFEHGNIFPGTCKSISVKTLDIFRFVW